MALAMMLRPGLSTRSGGPPSDRLRHETLRHRGTIGAIRRSRFPRVRAPWEHRAERNEAPHVLKSAAERAGSTMGGLADYL